MVCGRRRSLRAERDVGQFQRGRAPSHRRPRVVNTGGTLAGTGSIVDTHAGGGSLQVNAGGTFAPGTPGSIGTFTLAGSLTNAGTLFVAVNKGVGNSFASVGGDISLSNSILVVTNIGPALSHGDKFILFNKAVANVTGMTLVPPAGYSLTNDLALDGSVTIGPPTVNPNPTNLTVRISAGQVILSWPESHIGWRLQAQTNSTAVGLSTNWVTLPGTQLNNSYTNAIGIANGAVFYRMSCREDVESGCGSTGCCSRTEQHSGFSKETMTDMTDFRVETRHDGAVRRGSR